jgi:uncharacterized protein YyaL (SSP411 family)
MGLHGDSKARPARGRSALGYNEVGTREPPVPERYRPAVPWGAVGMNKLGDQSSPYLLQHKDNPVDWYPWGDEALEKARELGRPLFVSIGYSSCHWCHVMAHESFEDEETAQYMNTHLVPVKVDREERPDIDAIYMEAVQQLNGGRGGWPLSVFTTPDGKPFFGGTYFPPTARNDVPSFRSVLEAVCGAWATRRKELMERADALTAGVASRLEPAPVRVVAANGKVIEHAVSAARDLYDPLYGGIGGPPKFPRAPVLELLLHCHLAGNTGALEMATNTLHAMAAGGIYDHLGGGFARYATDRAWQVPHFEKMLYDQAMLARVNLHAWQATGDGSFRQVLDETLNYVLRDLRHPAGGVCSAEDADSGGGEGLFYTWTLDELEEVLGRDGAGTAAAWYGVTQVGAIEGRSVLHRPKGADIERPPEIEHLRAELFAARANRARPGIDDKVLTEWNAMIGAVLAEAGAATGNRTWVNAATEIGEFLLQEARRADGRWMRSWKDGLSVSLAVAADYAWLVECFTRLGESTGEARWTDHASDVAEDLISLFSSSDGGFYSTGNDADRLIVRPRDTYDGITPAANSVAGIALARLGVLNGDHALIDRAAASVSSAGEALFNSPLALPGLVSAALLLDAGLIEVVIGRAAERGLVGAVQRNLLPEVVLAWGEPTASPLWQGRDASDDQNAYVCRAGACKLPVRDPEALLDLVQTARENLTVRSPVDWRSGAPAEKCRASLGSYPPR